MRYFSLIAIIALYFNGHSAYAGKSYLLAGAATRPADADSTILEQRLSGYRFTNPLLECDHPQHSTERGIAVMEQALLHYTDSLKKAGTVTHVSIYYRDLNNGPWMGINEKENYAPASLLKVPILIAALKNAENNSWYLQSKFNYTDPYDYNYTQNLTDSIGLQKDSLYSIFTYLENMIAHSDNTSKNIILNSLPPDAFEKLFNDFGVSYNRDSVSGNSLSVKAYSAFFRILYNATYLNKEMSELALQMLTKTGFNRGMVNLLPAGTIVAHKFGERTDPNYRIYQLHDCGIVYKGTRPYLLCIMTQGKNFKTLEKVISTTSQMVYDRVE